MAPQLAISHAQLSNSILKRTPWNMDVFFSGRKMECLQDVVCQARNFYTTVCFYFSLWNVYLSISEMCRFLVSNSGKLEFLDQSSYWKAVKKKYAWGLKNTPPLKLRRGGAKKQPGCFSCRLTITREVGEFKSTSHLSLRAFVIPPYLRTYKVFGKEKRGSETMDQSVNIERTSSPHWNKSHKHSTIR